MVLCQERRTVTSHKKIALKLSSFDEHAEVIQVQKQCRNRHLEWNDSKLQRIWGTRNKFNSCREELHRFWLTNLDGIRQRIDTLPENLEVGPVRLELPPPPPTRVHTTFPTLDRIHDRS